MMKFEKPGPSVKDKPKAKRILIHSIEKPKELHCRRCNMTTGTECFRHYEGSRRSEFGKGTGLKCNNRMTAWLCVECDIVMSKKQARYGAFPLGTATELRIKIRDEEWLYLIVKTWLL